jgi:hypothetical protein
MKKTLFQSFTFEKPVNQDSYSTVAPEDFDYIENKIPEEDFDKIQNYWKSVVKKRFPKFCPDTINDASSIIPLSNLRTLAYDNSKLQEYYDMSTYPSFVAKYNSDLHPREARLSEISKRMIMPRAISSITETIDGKIIMGYRSNDVLAAGKETPLPQGMVKVAKTNDGPFMNIFSTVLDRLNNELGISPESVEDLNMLSICRHTDYPDISSGFYMKLSLNSNKVKKIAEEKISKGFNERLHFVDRASLKNFVINQPNTTGDSTSSALSYLKFEFGKKYIEPLVKDLEHE